MFQNLNDNS